MYKGMLYIYFILVANTTCSGNGKCNSDGDCECIGRYSGTNCDIIIPDTPSSNYGLSDVWGFILLLLLILCFLFIICYRHAQV